VLGEPNTIATRARIRDLVTDALARWEPRITVDAVTVDPLAGAGARAVSSAVRVEIAYRLVRTQASHRLGLTLVMEAGHAD
jgi:phage baseplate assembly protein W